MWKYEIFEAVIWGIFDMLAPLRMAEWGLADHFGQGFGQLLHQENLEKLSV